MTDYLIIALGLLCTTVWGFCIGKGQRWFSAGYAFGIGLYVLGLFMTTYIVIDMIV